MDSEGLKIYDVLHYDSTTNLAASFVLLIAASIVYCFVNKDSGFITSQVKLIIAIAVSDMINNGCLLTNGDTNIHGLSLIYIFESCSEILTSIAYWYLALKYWTASLTFISSLE